MNLVKTYIRGLVPTLLWLLLICVPVTNGAAHLVFSWWAVYVVLSYGFCFPRSYRVLQKVVHRSKPSNLNQPRQNAEEEAMRQGASYANTGRFGTGRLGDADGQDSRLIRWGTEFVILMFAVIAGPVVVAADVMLHRN